MLNLESDGFHHLNSLESKFESSTIQFGTPNCITLLLASLLYLKVYCNIYGPVLNIYTSKEFNDFPLAPPSKFCLTEILFFVSNTKFIIF